MHDDNRFDSERTWSGGDRREPADGGAGQAADGFAKPDGAADSAPAGEPAYFRYGPFASGFGAPNGNDRHEAARGAAGDGQAELPEGVRASADPAAADPAVDITPPPTVRPLPALPDAVGADASGAVRRRRSGRSRFRGFMSYFAAFMAGAVLIGGLMFAADKYDLFTAGAAAGQADTGGAGGGNVGAVSPGSRNANLANSSLDIVRPGSIAEIVDNSQAAVVKIETYSRRAVSTNPFYNDPFFRFFFGDDYSQPRRDQSGRLYKTGEGSGFIFDSEGYILTNQHVVDGADEIRVFVEGYENYFVAKKLGESYDLDLAALKIDGSAPFAYLRLGDADAMKVGDWVIAIGNPYGFDHTVTVGVLSAKGRPITIRDGVNTRKYENLLQTDASINPGNSGGPLLNLNGEVIGINTAVSSQAQGIGFAIPTSTISGVLDNLKNDKPIPKEPSPYIGVYLADLDDTWKEELGYKGDGVLVTQVEVDGPAHRAGIRAGDIITEVAGSKIKSSQDVIDAVRKQDVGQRITLKVVRQGKTYETIVTVGDRNAST